MPPRHEGPIAQCDTQAPGEATVEIQLTEQEQRALSEAAAVARAPTTLASPLDPLRPSNQCLWKRTARIDFISTATFAALVLAAAAMSFWHSRGVHADTTAAVRPSTPAPLRVMPTPDETPKAAPVQVTNPFDPTEVFELPAGTTQLEARALVADILLQRARDRLAQEARPKRVGLGHRRRVLEHRQTELFVTRLSASAR